MTVRKSHVIVRKVFRKVVKVILEVLQFGNKGYLLMMV